MDGVYEVEVEGLGHDGAGIARVDGFLLFVRGVLPGEIVFVRVVMIKKKYGHAVVERWERKSEQRVDPVCDLFDVCGGCQLQHLSYEGQLKFKKELVISNLKKFAGLDNAGDIVSDVLGMETPYRYRNKTQVPFGMDASGNVVGGFYKTRSHEIIDMPGCLVQYEIADEILLFVKELISGLGISTYDEASHNGVLRHVIIRTGFITGEVMVVLVTRTDELPHGDVFVSRLVKKFPGVKCVAQNVNSRVTNVICGNVTTILYGNDYIVDELSGIKFLISPRSFYQVNPVQTNVLYKVAVDFAGLSGDEVVIDAYCGIGTISLFLAQCAKHVYGVEIVPDAIVDARKNAELNGLGNVSFEVGASEVVIPRLIREGVRPDVIVVDPPRKGCDAVLLDAILGAKPDRVVYVSCDSATFARDVRILAEGGYVLDEVKPVDMFGQTSHVETVALLTLRETL